MTRTAPRILPFATLLIGMLAAGQVSAQGVTPGVVRDELRIRPTLPPTPSDTVQAPAAPSNVAGVAAGGRRILVQRFEIVGNSAVGSEVLQPIVAPYVGRELTLLEIYDVADLITRHYRTHGYTLASAYVPEQQVASGVITLEVIEGKLGGITTQGLRRTKERLVQWQLNELEPGAIVRDAELEREVLLMNDLPGVDARAVLQPGEEFGTSDLVLNVTEKRYDASIGLDNYGRESIGEWRVQADAALNGLLGVGDQLAISGVYAEADLMHYGRLAYNLPVTAWGTRAEVYYSSFDYAVDEKKLGPGFETYDIDGEGDNFGITLLHPVWRGQRKNLFLGIGFDRTVTRQTTQFVDDGPPDHRNLDMGLAVFTALFNYTAPDRSFSTLGASLSTNFDRPERRADVDPQNSPFDTSLENNAQTAKLQLDLTHYRTLWRQLAGIARITAVASPDPLNDLEQFRIGGPNGVRAYPASELAGDRGFTATGEVQHPVNMFPGFYAQRLKAFVDTGRVYRKNHNRLGIERSESLTGVGVGYQALAFGHVAVDATLAYPLGRHEASDDDDGVRFWTGISAEF
ncbi:MAG: ShlB/FhaC/HecB family hemolysin secretion/activation protein [Gammaproteobacteria bacterium]|nr:ShlB/FhaC/HecB family hemolysin secretion/activation protein [Gammaproteobacteria bacterium]